MLDIAQGVRIMYIGIQKYLWKFAWRVIYNPAFASFQQCKRNAIWKNKSGEMSRQ